MADITFSDETSRQGAKLFPLFLDFHKLDSFRILKKRGEGRDHEADGEGENSKGNAPRVF